MKKEREIVLEILSELGKQRYLKEIYHDTLKKYPDLNSLQKSFIKRLSQGSVERMITLDYIIRENSKLRLKKIDPCVLNILRLSVYQILFMDKIPEYSIVNEAVELVKKTKNNRTVPFSNALLRSILQRKEEYLVKLKDWQESNPCLAYSFPVELVELLYNTYEPEIVKQIMANSLREKPFNLRLLPVKEGENKKQSEEELQIFRQSHSDSLQSGGLFFDEVCQFHGNIEEESAFQKGYLHVQDESSMLVGYLGAKTNPQVVYDLCAAPGGKSVHLAQLLPHAEIYSYDLTQQKIEKIQQNIRRLALESIKTGVYDATVIDDTRKETADLVIADVPCSGTGVISSKVDLKYRVNATNIEELIDIQKSILAAAAAYVKKGGYLLYSTCSILPSENREQVMWFLEHNPEFEICAIQSDPIWQRQRIKDYEEKAQEKVLLWQGEMLQLLPSQIHGFFLTLLKRKA